VISPPFSGFLMAITEQDVVYVADLANLELTAEERTRFVKDLNSILEYIGRLNELNTDEVPPMAQVFNRFSSSQGAGIQPGSVQRDDVVRAGLPQKAALQNAPATDGAFFKVPKVIER
jgi:aspartyl-tRNA(Asn)/glutamyl-tRNA(Gln) amidotransferase subunit C